MNCRIFPHIYNVLKFFSRKKPSNGKSNFRDFSSQMKILKFLGIQPTHRGLKIQKNTYSIGIAINNFDPWFLINDIGEWSKDESVSIFWLLSFWMIPADFHSLTTNEFTSNSQIFWSRELYEFLFHFLGQFLTGSVMTRTFLTG